MRYSFRVYTVLSSVLLVSLFIGTSAAPARAQSDTAKKALESVKESVDTLVGAKDDNNPNDAVFRVEAFKKVLDFSVAEARNLKVKLIASFEGESSSTASWKDDAVRRIDAALAYYADEQMFVKENPDMTLDEIKSVADAFKAWRERTYLPLSEEVTDFLFVKQQGKTLKITEARRAKIGEDLAKLIEAFGVKKTQPLSDLYAEAASSTKRAGVLYLQARALFMERFVAPLFATTTSATSTAAATSTELTHASTSVTTSENGTSTAATETSTSLLPPVSIKDLIRESLTSVKDAYRVFIEMSNAVRKLIR